MVPTPPPCVPSDLSALGHSRCRPYCVQVHWEGFQVCGQVQGPLDGCGVCSGGLAWSLPVLYVLAIEATFHVASTDRDGGFIQFILMALDCPCRAWFTDHIQLVAVFGYQPPQVFSCQYSGLSSKELGS